MKNAPIRPWYKEFWAWVIIALPLSVIIACFITVNIAFINADAVVDANWRKNGLSIEKKMEEESHAKGLGLKASLLISRETGAVSLRLSTHLKSKAIKAQLTKIPQLTLSLEHPTQPKLDQKIVLNASSQGLFKGELKQFYSGVRYVTLSSPKDSWQLKGAVKLFTESPQFIR